MATEPDPALSPLQVGVILDRSSSTVRRMIDCGALVSFRAGSHRRVRLSEVNRFRREREKLWQALGIGELPDGEIIGELPELRQP